MANLCKNKLNALNAIFLANNFQTRILLGGLAILQLQIDYIGLLGQDMRTNQGNDVVPTKLLLDTFIHPPIQLVRRYTKRVSHHRASNDISWEFETQDNVEFDDPSEEHEAIIIEDEGDDIQRYLGDSDFSPQTLCDPGNEPLTFEYKQKAVKF
ncbi:hypothetical protein ABEB36_014295 [Hypothenemus hampei]|uniref:Uncharacterized protein n=1 Tax=Hypothenemus hampei TaxID=57062 RepID=A0ABD1E3X9_HYPHA